MEKNRSASLGMLTLSMVIFGSVGVVRKFIPLSSAALACFRGVAGGLLLYLFARLRGKKVFHRIATGKILLLILTGALMGLNWLFLFEAYRYTSVATATLCYYMQPTIVILLSPLVFREKITLRKGLCVLVSLAGMVLVSGVAEGAAPQAGGFRGVLFGLAAAVLYASVVIMNKKLPGIDSYEKTVIQLFSAAAVLVPSLLSEGSVLRADWTPAAVVMLLTVGVVHTGLAYALYFGSMDGLRAQTVALFSYLDPVVAMVLSAVVLKERMSVPAMVGAVLIIGAAVLCEIRPRTRRTEAP